MASPSVAKVQNDDSCFTLIAANTASPRVLEKVAIWLSEQWPRGGSHDAYLDKITENGSGSVFPCSFILMKGNTTPVGHGRILDCFENSGAKAAAFTYVIAKPRGHGHGRILMQQLEHICSAKSYHYVYVWTHTAIEFYQKSGYHETHRVSLQRPCLKILETTQVSKLEDLLSARNKRIMKDEDDHHHDKNARDKREAIDIAQKTSETILLPPVDPAEVAENEDVWLCKRLVETVPSLTVPREERLDELQQFFSSVVTCSSCYYHFLNLPWKQQIGPSCGLAALQMVLEFSNGGNEQGCESSSETKKASLLRQAQARHYTRDGEMFDIQNLCSLATDQNMDCEIVLVSETTPIQVWQQLATNRPIILPYDQQAYNRLPCLANGKSSHYGVIVGMMILNDKPLYTTSGLMVTTEESSENNPSHLQKRFVPLITLLDDDDAVDEKDDHLLNHILQDTPSTASLYLLVQHGMSRTLCIATWDDFMNSNQQLWEHEHVKLFQSNRPMNLANQMLFFKGKPVVA